MSLSKPLKIRASDGSTAGVLTEPTPDVLRAREPKHLRTRIETLKLRLGQVTDKNVGH